ncbi:MAG TPA: hypothetical protein GYA10_17870 [Alphaproteobacteria bacterium]|nr:hypothetical protein [Alphaproteobacteria bacterium]
MSVFRLAMTAAGVAVTLARHPVVRAGLRAAPHLITPAMREKANEAALTAAYRAGALARRIVPRKRVE